MAHSSTIRTVPAFTRTAAPSRFPRSLASILARIVHEFRVFHDLRRLQALDQRMLHDIGLTSGALEDVVRHGRGATSPSAGPAREQDLAVPHTAFTEWR